MTQKKSIVVLALAAMMAAAGCTEETITRGVSGEPKIVITDAEGNTSLVETTVLDFGPALVGDRLERKVTIRNNGRGEFRIAQITRDEAFSDTFRYQFEPGSVPVGESRELSFFFEPTEQGDFAGVATLEITDGTTDKLVITLQGRGVRGGCVIEPGETADFGSVATGTSYVMPVSIKNNSDLEWKVTIGDITSQTDEGAFTFANGFTPGELTVPAHDGILVPIEFKPNHTGQHSAFLSIPAPTMCKPSVLPLIGNGVDQVLIWVPQQVDFGFVNPGTKVESSVVFKNLGNRDVTVSGLEITNDDKKQFSLETSQNTFVVAKGGGEVEVPLGFKPSVLGGQAAKLAFTSDDTKLTAGNINLKGYGGGPDIAVQPRNVDFGPVAIGSFQFRRIVIANTGTDAPSTTDDNLKLEAKDANGKVAAKMPVLVESTPTGEFTLETPPLGYNTTGIQAGQTVDLRVKFTPTSAGIKTATIKIFSNDPDEAETEVVVQAEARLMPPCNYEIVPPQLRFGNVEISKNRTQSFYIRNRGTLPDEECLVSTLDFARGSAPAFTLPLGPQSQKIIAPGADLEIPVRFSPTTKSNNLEATVEFYISSPTAPEGKVKITGSSQDACLLIAPDDLDFGVIQTNCSSRERVFTVYNVCSSAVSLTGIDVQAGLSNEFRVTSRPPFPHSLAAGASVEFKAAYRPTDIGNDQGSIAVQTQQLAQPYVVNLAGRGATTAIQTDVFAQDPQPKVDVLIVIDDSCSMSDKQTSLGRNFDSFIKFATNQQVDFHIAVTTTSINYSSAVADNGRFVPVNDPSKRVLKPTTPNIAQQFAANVNVGINADATEAALEAAYMALSGNNLSGHNAGFLRDEAHLAIVLVTDATDQSSQSVNFYYNYFLNIKGFRRANDMSVSGIIPTLPSSPGGGCSYDDSSAGQSTRMREIVTRTGGIYDEICTPDWAKSLEKLGQKAFGDKTRVFMTNLPDMTVTPNPITVEIDGKAYPATGPGGDVRWTYNSTANATVRAAGRSGAGLDAQGDVPRPVPLEALERLTRIA